MITAKCPSCGHTHNVPDAEAERLRAALAEYTARAERTIAAQQEEIARLRLLVGKKETEHGMAR